MLQSITATTIMSTIIIVIDIQDSVLIH